MIMEIQNASPYRYKAYICSSRGSVDVKTAHSLYYELSRFIIPQAFRSTGQNKRPGEFYLRREDSREGTGLSEKLCEALHQSEYLIVVYSGQSEDSARMALEITYFQSLGREDHIIFALTGNSPEELLPQPVFNLKFASMSSAHAMPGANDSDAIPGLIDLRAPHFSGNLKKMRKEKFKILAILLNCSHEDLQQKQGRKKTGRIALVVAAMLLFTVSALAGNAFYRNKAETNRRDQVQTEIVENMSHMAQRYDHINKLLNRTLSEIETAKTQASQEDPTLNLDKLKDAFVGMSGDLVNLQSIYPITDTHLDLLTALLEEKSDEAVQENLENYINLIRASDEKLNVLANKFLSTSGKIDDPASAAFELSMLSLDIQGILDFYGIIYCDATLLLQALDYKVVLVAEANNDATTRKLPEVKSGDNLDDQAVKANGTLIKTILGAYILLEKDRLTEMEKLVKQRVEALSPPTGNLVSPVNTPLTPDETDPELSGWSMNNTYLSLITLLPDETPDALLAKARALRDLFKFDDAVKLYTLYGERFKSVDPYASAFSKAAVMFTLYQKEFGSATGLYVLEVTPDSKGDKAGLLPGDILLSYGGTKNLTVEGLLLEIEKNKSQSAIEIEVLRFDSTGVVSNTTLIIKGGAMGLELMPL